MLGDTRVEVIPGEWHWLLAKIPVLWMVVISAICMPSWVREKRMRRYITLQNKIADGCKEPKKSASSIPRSKFNSPPPPFFFFLKPFPGWFLKAPPQSYSSSGPTVREEFWDMQTNRWKEYSRYIHKNVKTNNYIGLTCSKERKQVCPCNQLDDP